MDNYEKVFDASEKMIELVSEMDDSLLLAFMYAIVSEMVDRKVFERKKEGH